MPPDGLGILLEVVRSRPRDAVCDPLFGQDRAARIAGDQLGALGPDIDPDHDVRRHAFAPVRAGGGRDS
jgi:hypothetical protein